MGTHPIFESDFDCLTEWFSFLAQRVARISKNQKWRSTYRIAELNQ